MRSFAAETRWPGNAPDRILLLLDDEEFWLRVPATIDLLDIAANYHWRDLVPGGLEEPGRSLLLEWLADPDHPASWQRLHVVMQPIGIYLYGFPFFTAARLSAQLLAYFPVFRLWSVQHLRSDMDSLDAAGWCAAAMSWLLSANTDEKDRNRTWAELTTPSRLPTEVPGVLPSWMA